MKYSIDKRLHESTALLRRSLQWLELNNPIESDEAKGLKQMLVDDIRNHLKVYDDTASGAEG